MNKQVALALGALLVLAVGGGLFFVVSGERSREEVVSEGAEAPRARRRGPRRPPQAQPLERPAPAPVVETPQDPASGGATQVPQRPAGTPPAPEVGTHANAGALQVRCLLDGEPLPGATVLGRFSDGSGGEWRTGGDGTVEVPVPQGLTLSVAASHATGLRLDWRPALPGGSAVTFQFQHSGEPAWLEGALLDDAGQGLGEGELVLVNADQQGHAVLDRAQAQLRPDGRFAFELPAGRYALRGRLGPSESAPSYFTLAPGQRHDVGTLRVPRPSSLAGRVGLPASLRLAFPIDARIVIEVRSEPRENDPEPPGWGRRIVRGLQLDATLAYALELPPGELRLRVELPIPGDHQVGHWTGVTLEPGASQSLDLELGELAVALRGIVRDDTGRAIPGAKVGYRGTTALTDDQGGYALRGLDMGDFELSVHAPGHEQGFVRKTFTGSALVADFTLQRLGALRGVVKDGEGQPKAGAPLSITLRKDTGEVVPFEARTSSAGSYALRELVPGRYTVGSGAVQVQVEVRPGDEVEAPELRVP